MWRGAPREAGGGGRAVPVITFASPKGGVGKTTLAANVAAAIAAAGHRVVALDLDPQAALGLHFGLGLTETAAADPFASLTRSRATAAAVHLVGPGRLSMEAALAWSHSLAAEPELLRAPLTGLLAGEGVLVVDTPPGPSPGLAALLPRTDLLVTVLLADAASLALIPAIESGLCYGAPGQSAMRAGRTGFALNQCDNRTRLGHAAAQAAARHFGPRLLGAVYRDAHVAEALAAQRLVREHAPQARAGHDIAVLAGAILQRHGLGAVPPGAVRHGTMTVAGAAP